MRLTREAESLDRLDLTLFQRVGMPISRAVDDLSVLMDVASASDQGRRISRGDTRSRNWPNRRYIHKPLRHQPRYWLDLPENPFI